ncbi:hypothetical protein EYR38_010023 [Pleurotus pulmonarius]|nr:hypothetical protein EYR38_010023 [Pleurotus pulmonarius]
MANWIDLFSLFATIAVFGGIIYGVLYLVNSVSQGVASTKEALANKGLHISDKGMSVKTSKRFDREDYVDATQRYVASSSAKLPSDTYTLQGIHQSDERRIIWTRIVLFTAEHRTIRLQLKSEEKEQTRLACMYYIRSDRSLVRSKILFFILVASNTFHLGS